MAFVKMLSLVKVQSPQLRVRFSNKALFVETNFDKVRR